MGDLTFWNIHTIGRNNRAQKIHALGKIEVTGVKITHVNSKAQVFSKISETSHGFKIDLDFCNTIETLEMHSPSEFYDMEGEEVDMEDFDFISENWSYDREANTVEFNYEFLIYEKQFFGG